MSSHSCKSFPKGCGRFRDEARWTGLNTCHCAVCGEHFTSERAFEMHYTMDTRRGIMECKDPTTATRDKDGLPLFTEIPKPKFDPPRVWTPFDPRGAREWWGDLEDSAA